VVFLHGFGDHSGLYRRFGNALNGAGIELWALITQVPDQALQI